MVTTGACASWRALATWSPEFSEALRPSGPFLQLQKSYKKEFMENTLKRLSLRIKHKVITYAIQL